MIHNADTNKIGLVDFDSARIHERHQLFSCKLHLGAVLLSTMGYKYWVSLHTASLGL